MTHVSVFCSNTVHKTPMQASYSLTLQDVCISHHRTVVFVYMCVFRCKVTHTHTHTHHAASTLTAVLQTREVLPRAVGFESCDEGLQSPIALKILTLTQRLIHQARCVSENKHRKKLVLLFSNEALN